MTGASSSTTCRKTIGDTEIPPSCTLCCTRVAEVGLLGQTVQFSVLGAFLYEPVPLLALGAFLYEPVPLLALGTFLYEPVPLLALGAFLYESVPLLAPAPGTHGVCSMVVCLVPTLQD